jgi:hypothetical protein
MIMTNQSDGLFDHPEFFLLGLWGGPKKLLPLYEHSILTGPPFSDQAKTGSAWTKPKLT